jgi:uncharacterized membrane protein YgdD (TMEM256/DUF423 family)
VFGALREAILPRMAPRTMVRAGALLGGSAVAAGAFGAHGLRDVLTASGELAVFETAVRYQMWHALALLACAALQHAGRRCSAAAWCFLLGSVVFCGTLYSIALTEARWPGAVTPVGGVLFIAGWIALLCAR